MFRCNEVVERASLLIDGDLGFWLRLNIRLHLAICRGCRAFVEQMRITHELTAMAGATFDSEPSEEIAAALARRQMGPGKKA